jgi:hypothetical protein
MNGPKTPHKHARNVCVTLAPHLIEINIRIGCDCKCGKHHDHHDGKCGSHEHEHHGEKSHHEE